MSDNLTNILANAARDRVFATIKVVGVTGCYVHPNHTFCGCAVAMSLHTEHDFLWCKRVWYCMIFEQLVLSKPHAYAYNGTIESHDAFIAAEGMTPKKFLRKYILGEARQAMFGPTTSIANAVQALHDLWLARHKQWKERYGDDREAADDKWRVDEYPDRPEEEIVPNEALVGVGLQAAPTGGAFCWMNEASPCTVRMMGTDEHRMKATFTKTDPRDVKGVTPYGVTVEKIEMCHDNCKTGLDLFEKELPAVAKGVLAELEPRQGEKGVYYPK
ncbi:hypothetical protein HII31_07605 [Pseudocercospora fuligena]|uniref:Uncharacterized protein n=1 Tax=Pseudocercospora fuligena TaxID=685502 RepID=A0A8H6VLG1_9PEZI|nr:hypothetical protein HII31_07605 [Pseudocercospora fuligena]